LKISAQVAGVIAVLFALVCYGVAITGFTSLGEVTDAQGLADAKGFAWFWAFLGTIGVVFAAVSWWMAKGQEERRR
jgi:hypothetical protein